MERQLTRIDYVRQHLDRMLKSHKDPETSRNGYVHLYGVGQACALIALSRGHNRQYAELAEIAGMLHDYSKYYECIEEKHAEKSQKNTIRYRPLYRYGNRNNLPCHPKAQ